MRYPLLGLSLDCDREETSGGVAAGNTVRQGYCYTCLAIVGGISVGSLRYKTMRSLRKASQTQKSSLISKETGNKVVTNSGRPVATSR